MSHDTWASFSTTELARDCLVRSENWFSIQPSWDYQSFATRDPSSGWPYADGAVDIVPLGGGENRTVAVEFKRRNEGIHGILTGIGQSISYLHKGFWGSILVVPNSYETLANPGLYIRNVLETAELNSSIGVFTYEEPDLTQVSPFLDRLTCVKPLDLDFTRTPRSGADRIQVGRQKTQWAHVREGSTTPDTLFRFLGAILSASNQAGAIFDPSISDELRRAVETISPGASPAHYLSNTPEDRISRPLADYAWRRFWFTYVLTSDVQEIWICNGGTKSVSASPTLLKQWNGDPMVFFARRGTVKSSYVNEINAGTLSEAEAWIKFAKNIRDRAHQFREDIDSGAEAVGFVDRDGRLTDSGFRYLTVCDRAGFSDAPQALQLLRQALLAEGAYLALLHYIHSISEQCFEGNPLEFSSLRADGISRNFESVPYRNHLIDELTNNLRVAGSSRTRGGRARPPLEAEFITLRKLGLIGGFRVGLGLEINWPAVHNALDTSN